MNSLKMDIQIRQEEHKDIEAIYDLIKSAFMRNNESEVVGRLRHGNSFIPELSLVALLENKIVGHILFTKIDIVSDDGTRHESLALAPLSVSPEYQRQGIGGILVKHGLEAAKQAGSKSVIVLGHENYYTKFGFISTQRWNIRYPFDDIPTSAFMGIELEAGALARISSGRVEYPKEFESVS